MAEQSNKEVKETSNVKSKFSGNQITEKELAEYNQTWINIEESIEGLEEQNNG